MKFSTSLVAAAAAGLANAAPAQLESRADSVTGFDISGYQTSVDYAGAYKSGARFVIIKVSLSTLAHQFHRRADTLQATEGTSYTDDMFDTHYAGATDAGLIRGGYHYARPSSSAAADQVDYFIKNGGNWSDDGITLPGMLDIEYNPGSGNDCYDMDPDSIVSWVSDFVKGYKDATGVYPMIYTNLDWWSRCAGNSDAFVDMCPLVVASYSSSVGTLPGGWEFQTIWQYSDAYEYGGDADSFNGDEAGLKALAKG